MKTVRVDQLKFNKSCTSFIGDLKKSVKIPKLSQSIPHLTQKKQNLLSKRRKRKIIFYDLDGKLLILFDVNRIT